MDSDSCLRDTDNHYLDFLGLVACPVDGCKYVCFDDGLAHWNNAHSEGTPIDSRMAESGAVEKERTVMTDMMEEDIWELYADFLPAVEICPPKYREELKYDLWNNRPLTAGEAVQRAIAFLQHEQNPPSANSLL